MKAAEALGADRLTSIKDALHALVTAAVDHDLARPASPSGPLLQVTAAANLADRRIPTRAESELANLIKDPVGASLRKSIRALGQDVFNATNSIGVMTDVADHVAGRDDTKFGRRASIIDHAWNAIGNEEHGMWWS